MLDFPRVLGFGLSGNLSQYIFVQFLCFQRSVCTHRLFVVPCLFPHLNDDQFALIDDVVDRIGLV